MFYIVFTAVLLCYGSDVILIDSSGIWSHQSYHKWQSGKYVSATDNLIQTDRWIDRKTNKLAALITQPSLLVEKVRSISYCDIRCHKQVPLYSVSWYTNMKYARDNFLMWYTAQTFSAYSWNPAQTHLSNFVNTMATVDLPTQGARASAAMILTLFTRSI